MPKITIAPMENVDHFDFSGVPGLGNASVPAGPDGSAMLEFPAIPGVYDIVIVGVNSNGESLPVNLQYTYAPPVPKQPTATITEG